MMSTFLVALSTWLHALVTIVFIGYYLFTCLVYLCDLLEQASSRFRHFFGSSLLIFLVTGTHLMLINKNYLGLGNFFGNP